MTAWAPRRFWAEARAVPADDGWGIALDARPVRTPARAPLILPTRALAEAVAAEWGAQGDLVLPATMPFTRSANTAIDTVRPRFGDVAATVAAYGESDLLCYRAEAPLKLVQAQAAAWDPLLDWADAEFGARLATGRGIVHVPQDPRALSRLAERVTVLSPFALSALHDLVALTGSLIIGLAALGSERTPESLWAASRIDEDWQAAQWGQDEEASANAERRRRDFLSAQSFLRLSRRTDQGNPGTTG
ncbi:MAG: ATP12 family chaperone protein [Paracoccaceae bacterium]